MSEITLDDLRVPCEHGAYRRHTADPCSGECLIPQAHDICEGERPVSDADLASLGYVRLDGIDVDMLAWMRHEPNRMEHPTDWGAATEYVALAVLAAIDQEPSDVG